VKYVPTILDRLTQAGQSWKLYADQHQGQGGYQWSVCPSFAECLHDRSNGGKPNPNWVARSQFYRDAKVGSIYEGTSNMQLQTIAKRLLSDGDGQFWLAGFFFSFCVAHSHSSRSAGGSFSNSSSASRSSSPCTTLIRSGRLWALNRRHFSISAANPDGQPGVSSRTGTSRIL